MTYLNNDYSKFFPEGRELAPSQPKPHDRLVRFLSLTKGIHFFESKALHFQRLDMFDDKDEGLWTGSDAEKWKAHGSFDVPKFTENFRQTTAITCWSKVNEELDVARIWKEYVCCNQGLAIVTSAAVLCDLVKAGLTSMGADFVNSVIAEVKYVDRTTYSNFEALRSSNQPLNAFLPYYQKSKKMDFEEEVRLLLHPGWHDGKQWAIDEKGVNVPIHINELVREIWLPPDMAGWEREGITCYLERFDLHNRVAAPLHML